MTISPTVCPAAGFPAAGSPAATPRRAAPRVRALLVTAALLAPVAAQDLLVQCRTLVVAPDTVVEPGELLLRDGKVAYLGREIPAEARARAKVLAFTDATIVPGFVLAHTALGRDGELGERAAPLVPDLLAADAFDPFQKELLRLPRHAVTACLLSPSSANVAGGIAALVKPGAEQGSVRQDRAYARFALAGPVRAQDREPTSLMGAIDLLREALRAAKNGEPRALGPVLRADQRMVVHVETRAEILAALALGAEFGFEPVLLGASAADEVLDAIQKARATVALWALHPAMRDAQLGVPRELERRAVPFCFFGEPQALRAGAALAVRHGTSRKQALAALTRVPAELAKATDAVGSLRRGCDADFAVFGGDPLDLSSPLLAVYVDGVRLHGDAPPLATPAPDLAKEGL